MKEVWILGAGFSYPLGAPLFGQVFSHGQEHIARQVTNREDNRWEYRRAMVLRTAALALYRLGAKIIGSAPLHWRDPEEFLQKLSDAVRIGNRHPLHTLMLNTISGEATIEVAKRYDLRPGEILHDALDAAKIEMAIETSHFLAYEDFTGEKWMPYRKWLQSLNDHDTVVTFNYDQALERLIEADPKLSENRLEVILPDGTGIATDCPRLLKLHGSNGWYEGKGDNGTFKDGVPRVIWDPTSPPEIYIPGPEKMAKSILSPIWALAMNAIERADRIHIIGYSFPVTDSFAADSILSAMAARVQVDSGSRVTTVLGPGYSTDGERIRATLAGLCRSVENLPMHAQHYLLRVAEAKGVGRREHF